MVGGIFGYKKLTDNPTKILKKSINDLYANFSDTLKDYGENPVIDAILNDTVKFNGEFSLTGSLFETIKDDKVNFSLGLDAKNESMEMYAGLDEKNQTLADISFYGKDGKGYMASKTLFDNLYTTGEIDLSSLGDSVEEIKESLKNTSNVEDLDAIVKDFKDALINSLDEKQLTKEKAELTINDETIKVNRLTYNIDGDSIKNLFTSIFKELQGNKNFIDKLVKVSGMSEEEIKAQLEELAKPEYYDEVADTKEKFILYTTTSKNSVVGIELVDDEGNFRYYNHEGNFNIRFQEGKETVFEIVGKKEKDATKVTFKLDSNGDSKLEDLIVLNVKQFNDEGIDCDYTISSEGQSITGTFKATLKKTSDKKYEGVLEFSAAVPETGDMGMKMNYSVEIGTKIADIDTSKAIDAESITSQDSLKLMQAMENLEKSNFVTFVSQIMNSLVPPVETDYDDFL